MERIDLNHPITEDDIVNFLVSSPDFFVRHADVLSAITIASPHGHRAVSLQERQAEMLRAKIKALEQRIVEMMGNAHDNMVIADRLEQWSCRLLRVDDPALLPARVAQELSAHFDIPQVAIRLWDLAEPFAHAPFAQGVSEDARIFASSLTAPFCGANPGFEVADWLDDREAAVSLALIPLYATTRAERAQEAAFAGDAATAAESPAAVAPGTPQTISRVAAGDGRIEPTLGPADEPVAPPAEPAIAEPAPAEAREAAPVCGLLVFASSDPKRFQSGMGTEFLERLGDLAGAALSRLRADAE